MSKRPKSTGAEPDRAPGPADVVRTAVEQAFSATAGGAALARGRAGELVDDLASAAGRVREALDDFRVLEDIKGLRAELDALSARVAALEGAEEPKRRSPVQRVPSRRLPDPRAGFGSPTTRASSRPRPAPGPSATPDAPAPRR